MSTLASKRVITWIALGGEMIASFQGKTEKRRNRAKFKVYNDANRDDYREDVVTFLATSRFPEGIKL